MADKKKPAAKPAAKKPSGVIYEPATVEACRRDYEAARAYREGNSNRC